MMFIFQHLLILAFLFLNDFIRQQSEYLTIYHHLNYIFFCSASMCRNSSCISTHCLIWCVNPAMHSCC